jgi:uncharacterized phage protein gp47/JayE
MTVEELPGEIVTTTRDREIERWKRAHKLRVPDADVGEGTQPDIDARIAADMLMPLYAAAKVNGENAVLERARGKALEQWADREGVEPRREASGAVGFVEIEASAGGGTVPAGDELRHESSGLRFEVITTDHYNDEDQCGIRGKDTGPATNMPAGTQLKWTSPRPGIGATVTVLAQSDGSGLSGGRDRENEDELSARVQQEKRTRAASGNDAEYQQETEKTPGVSVQKSFTYPALMGGSTTCVVFTLQPEHAGGSRIPNSLQVALVESHVVGKFPGDDGAFFALLQNEDVDVAWTVEWNADAIGWADINPWPAYYAVSPSSGPGAVQVASATSSTVFQLATANGIYTGLLQPEAGQTLAFYDPAKFTWRRKRILSFTGTGPWDITCDTTNNVSDQSYTPSVGQRACPWSDSLTTLLQGIWDYFDTLGPGEQQASFYDEGRRQRRQPLPPKHWPHTLTSRGLTDAITADSVDDVRVLEGDGAAPSVGTPGVLSNILKLRFVYIFEEDT